MSGCATRSGPPTPAGPWPGDRTALVFGYGENPEAVFALGPDGQPDRSYKLSPTGLLSRGMALLDRDNVMRLAGGSYEAQSAGGPAAAAIASNGAFSIEVCITPETLAKRALTIISLEPARRDGGTRLALVQIGRAIGLVLAASGAAPRPIVLCNVDARGTSHVTVTYRPGRLTCYRNGQRVAGGAEIREPFEARGPYRLVLGDTYAGDSDWAGRLEGVALYARELRPSEVHSNWRARLALAARRPKVPVLRIRATLLEHSDPPRPGRNPYYRALAVSHYRVDKVIEGRYDRREILVAHWARWRNTLLPFCTAPVGQSLDLVLEPIERSGKRVSRADQSFTLDDTLFDLPWYYDAGLMSLTYRRPKPTP